MHWYEAGSRLKRSLATLFENPRSDDLRFFGHVVWVIVRWPVWLLIVLPGRTNQVGLTSIGAKVIRV